MSFGILDIVFLALIIFLGHYRIQWLAKRHGAGFAEHKKNLTYIFYYKIFIGIGYVLYVIFLGGDAQGYWSFGLQQVQVIDPTWYKYYGVSTTFILFVIYPFSQILGLSFFTGSMMFVLIGFMGMSYVYLMLMPYSKYISIKGIKVFPALFFLPNLQFWCSGVGKDALIFFAIAIFIYSTRSISRNFIWIILGFVLAFHIRPHIGALLGASLLASFLIGGDLTIPQKFVGLVLGVAGLIVIWPQVTEFLQLEEVSVSSIQNLAEGQIEALGRARTGSSIDLANYSIPYRIFSFLFRPLFFDAHNAFALFASTENLAYLLMALSLIKTSFIKAFRKAPIFIKTGLLAFIGSTLAFSNSLSNLGIALRMKNMTMVYLLLFACFAAAYHNYSKMNKT